MDCLPSSLPFTETYVVSSLSLSFLRTTPSTPPLGLLPTDPLSTQNRGSGQRGSCAGSSLYPFGTDKLQVSFHLACTFELPPFPCPFSLSLFPVSCPCPFLPSLLLHSALLLSSSFPRAVISSKCFVKHEAGSCIAGPLNPSRCYGSKHGVDGRAISHTPC